MEKCKCINWVFDEIREKSLYCKFCPKCGKQLREECPVCGEMEFIGRPICAKEIREISNEIEALCPTTDKIAAWMILPCIAGVFIGGWYQLMYIEDTLSEILENILAAGWIIGLSLLFTNLLMGSVGAWQNKRKK